MISFTVYGNAKPQGNKRHVGNGAMVELPGLKEWRQMTAAAAIDEIGAERELLQGPLAMRLTFYEPRPLSHYGKKGLKASAPPFPHKTRTGDGDKLTRAIFDALARVLYHNDKQIVDHHTRKLYGEPARVEVEIRTL